MRLPLSKNITMDKLVIGTVYEWKPRGPLIRGVRCKACDKSISSDPELCPKCLQAVRNLIRDVDMPDDIEVLDYAADQIS